MPGIAALRSIGGTIGKLIGHTGSLIMTFSINSLIAIQHKNIATSDYLSRQNQLRQ
jgi:hypothetical protein